MRNEVDDAFINEWKRLLAAVIIEAVYPFWREARYVVLVDISQWTIALLLVAHTIDNNIRALLLIVYQVCVCWSLCVSRTD